MKADYRIYQNNFPDTMSPTRAICHSSIGSLEIYITH